MTLISLDDFAYRNDTHPDVVKLAVEMGLLPTVDGMLDSEVAQPIWDSTQGCITIEMPADDARGLRAQAEKAGMTLERYLRKRAGLEYPLQ